MLKRLISLLLVFIFLVTSSGCATIAHGTSTSIRINSIPPGAKAVVGGNTVITPATVTLKNSQSYDIVFRKEGYEETTFMIQRDMSGWIFGNILLVYLVVIGAVVDVATGSAYKLTPTEVNVTLTPLNQ